MEEASLSSSWAIIFMAILLIAFISWSFTYLLIKFLTKIKILDHPNERSNHKVPIPVGGGIAIIATFALMIWLQNLIAEHYQWSQEAVSVFVFALILALVSFIDDILKVFSHLSIEFKSLSRDLRQLIIKVTLFE